jgi:REP element-mobilizing transposase RayT
LLRDEEREKLHAYMIGVLENLKSPSLHTNSVKDHVHILFSRSKNHSLAHVIGEVKESSSAWIKKEDSWYGDFYWQSGYAAFSVSESGGGSAALHPETGGASQEDFVSG